MDVEKESALETRPEVEAGPVIFEMEPIEQIQIEALSHDRKPIEYRVVRCSRPSEHDQLLLYADDQLMLQLEVVVARGAVYVALRAPWRLQERLHFPYEPENLLDLGVKIG